MNEQNLRIISEEKIKKWVKSLSGEGIIIAPMKNSSGDLTLVPVASENEIDLSPGRDLLPAKRYLFPPSETLFCFEKKDGIRLFEKFKDEKQVFFAIRSCDVTGIRFLENFFKGKYEDPYFKRRLENSVFISLACHESCDTGFCVCCDGGPYLKDGYDVQLSYLGDKYLVEIGSEKGKMLIEKNADLFGNATEADTALRNKIMDGVNQKLLTSSYVSRGITKLSTEQIPAEQWEEFADSCFHCGGCTYVCPTCSCFHVIDRPLQDDKGERVKIWDSCQYGGFTREASGHNPREECSERYKRWFFHKLSLQYVEINGRHGCVGCGRCMITCFGMVDMSSFLKKVRRWDGKTAVGKILGE